MINLFRFLLRNSSFFLFIIFEIIAIYLVINYNQTQREIFIDATSRITAVTLEKNDQFRDYFNLQNINESLNQENSALLNKLAERKILQSSDEGASFAFQDAKVISNQIDSRYNRYVINKGKNEGVSQGMGVMSASYPVGIIFQTTDHYASAISLLNINLNLSVKIRSKDYFGTLTWQPPNPRESVLSFVPAYADVLVGDTVVTSGFSHIFPKDLPVGIVSDVTTPKGSNSHEIFVNIFADMGRLNHVQLIENVDRSEIDSLKAAQ